jgi:plastocyanin
MPLPAALRRLTVLIPLTLAACASHPSVPDRLAAAPASTDWGMAQTVTVKLTDFDYTPSDLTFTAGKPVKVVLVNSGSDLHDFSAPAFFAGSALKPGSTGPGKVAVAKNQTAEIDLVPGAPGKYPLECTELLHAMLGMTGTITVIDASH